MDLSCSLGVPGEMDHPKLVEAVEHVIEVAHKNNVAMSILSMTVEGAQTWYDRGMRLLTWSNEIRIVGQASTRAVKEFGDFLNKKES